MILRLENNKFCARLTTANNEDKIRNCSPLGKWRNSHTVRNIQRGLNEYWDQDKENSDILCYTVIIDMSQNFPHITKKFYLVILYLFNGYL